MNDPVYKSGVDADSLIKTVYDIVDSFKGRLSRIAVPLPLDGSPPLMHMTFKDNDLEIKTLKLNTKNPTSRKYRSYILRHGIDHPVDNEESEEVMGKSNAIRDDEMEQEYAIEDVEHYLGTMNKPNDEIIKDKITSKSSENAVPSPFGSRRVRRVGNAA